MENSGFPPQGMVEMGGGGGGGRLPPKLGFKLANSRPPPKSSVVTIWDTDHLLRPLPVKTATFHGMVFFD